MRLDFYSLKFYGDYFVWEELTPSEQTQLEELAKRLIRLDIKISSRLAVSSKSQHRRAWRHLKYLHFFMPLLGQPEDCLNDTLAAARKFQHLQVAKLELSLLKVASELNVHNEFVPRIKARLKKAGKRLRDIGTSERKLAKLRREIFVRDATERFASVRYHQESCGYSLERSLRYGLPVEPDRQREFLAALRTYRIKPAEVGASSEEVTTALRYLSQQ